MEIEIKKIRIPNGWNDLDSERHSLDVFVDTEDGYTYILSVATTKHIEFLMNREKTNYYGPSYAFIVVKDLTKEIIEETINAYAKESGGYWLKMYHFAGNVAYIDDSLFEELKAEDIEREKEWDESIGLDKLIRLSKSGKLDELTKLQKLVELGKLMKIGKLIKLGKLDELWELVEIDEESDLVELSKLAEFVEFLKFDESDNLTDS